MEFVILGNDSRRFKCSVRGVYRRVYNQKRESICLPIAMATATTVAYVLKYGYIVDISPQPFIDLGVRSFRDAKLLITSKDYGLQQHCDYPFIFIRGKLKYQTGHRYTLYDAKILVGYEQIRDALIQNFGQWGPKYPIVACVDMTGFVHDKSTPFRRNTTIQVVVPSSNIVEEEDLVKRPVAHAVVITGLDTSSLYDEEHSVEIQNSYGEHWGEGGFSTVTYHFLNYIFVPVMRGDNKGCKKHRHPLYLNTIDHTDSVNGLCFSADGHNLATVCNDGIVRIFELDDVSSESFRFKSVNMRPGCRPTGVVFVGDSSSSVVVATHGTETFLHMYEDNSTGQNFSIKWVKQMVDNTNIITLFGALVTHGGAEGSTIILTSDGTDIRVWQGDSGKFLGMDEIENNMACISPNGRFIAAAALDTVKVREIVNSSVPASQVDNTAMVAPFAALECAKVTWLCFSPDSERIITASEDGRVQMLHIAAKEEPKTLKEFPIPREGSKNSTTSHYDRLCISPDGKILAAVTQASVVQWLSIDTGEVLDTADKAHEGDITSISWAPKPLLVGDQWVNILATSGVDKKVKLWAAPTL